MYQHLRNIGQIFQSLFLLAIRLFWGYQFFRAGIQKLNDIDPVVQFFTTLGIWMPLFSAHLVAWVETIGGLCLMLGLAARLAAIPLTICMITAYLTAHIEVVKNIFSNTEEFLEQPPFLYLLVSLIVFAFGPGKYSLDALICYSYRKIKDRNNTR